MTISWFQFLGGIGLGIGLSLAVQKFVLKEQEKEHEDDSDEWEDTSDDDSEEDDDTTELVNDKGPTKMVLAVRTDLKMGKGKIAAQCCHAAVAAYKKAKARPGGKEILEAWEMDGSRKIAVKVPDEEQLLTVFAIARSLGLVSSIIQDAGRTQIEPGSKTVVAVGPGPEALVDQVTREFGLL